LRLAPYDKSAQVKTSKADRIPIAGIIKVIFLAINRQLVTVNRQPVSLSLSINVFSSSSDFSTVNRRP